MTNTTKSRVRQAILPVFAGILALGAVGPAFAGEHGTSSAAVAAFQGSPMSLADAVRVAEGAGQGQVVGAEFGVKDGAGIWQVTTQDGATETDLVIDPAAGTILSSTPDAEGPEAGDDETKEIADMAAAKVSILDAVAAIEAQGARAMEVEYGYEGDALIFEAKVMNADGSVSEVLVDAQSGQVMPGEDGADDEGGEEAEGETEDDGEDADGGEGEEEGEEAGE